MDVESRRWWEGEEASERGKTAVDVCSAEKPKMRRGRRGHGDERERNGSCRDVGK